MFNGDNNSIITQFNAFDPGFTGGVNVAVGDVNNDGISDILCAPARRRPQIRVISGRTSPTCTSSLPSILDSPAASTSQPATSTATASTT